MDSARFSGTLTPHDLAAAQVLHQGWGRRFAPILLATIIAGGLGSGMGYGTTGVFVCFVGLGGAMAAAKILGPLLSARFAFRRQPSLTLATEGVFSSAGVDATTENTTSSTPWKMYVRHLRSKNHLLLYHSPEMFSIYPRRWFESDQAFQLAGNLANQNTRGRSFWG